MSRWTETCQRREDGLRKRITELEEMLRKCELTFRRYASSHDAKAQQSLADLQDLPAESRLGSGLIEEANDRSSKAQVNMELATEIVELLMAGKKR